MYIYMYMCVCVSVGMYFHVCIYKLNKSIFEGYIHIWGIMDICVI